MTRAEVVVCNVGDKGGGGGQHWQIWQVCNVNNHLHRNFCHFGPIESRAKRTFGHMGCIVSPISALSHLSFLWPQYQYSPRSLLLEGIETTHTSTQQRLLLAKLDVSG